MAQEWLWRDDMVAGLVELSGGRLEGRSRLLRTGYLLDRCGAHFGIRYSYTYGPYGNDLVQGAYEAIADGRITEQLGSGRVPYWIFTAKGDYRKPKFGRMSSDRARRMLKITNEMSYRVVEMAATMVFLRDDWYYVRRDEISPKEEVVRRMPLIGTPENVARACELVERLGLGEVDRVANGAGGAELDGVASRGKAAGEKVANRLAVFAGRTGEGVYGRRAEAVAEAVAGCRRSVWSGGGRDS